MTLIFFPGSRTEMTTRASRMLGKAVSASLRRIRISSTGPPKYPVRAPVRQPHTAPMARVARAMEAVAPAPLRTRLKISRPKLSVPIQWAGDGGSNLGPAAMALGS